MSAIWTIAMKDLLLLRRNKAALFWVVGLPILMALFFGSIGGGGGRAAMPVAIVNEDSTAYARALVGRLRGSEALRVRETTLDSARTLVRRGDLAAYVAIHPGTGESFGFGGDSTSGIEIGVDPRRTAEKETLRGMVTAALFRTMQGSFGSGGLGREQIERSLERIRADTTLAPLRRSRGEAVLRSLDQFMTTLDTSGVAASAPGAGVGAARALAGGDSASDAGGPNIRVVEVAEEESGPRTAYEVTFPSSISWALIGVCMSFAVSIVYERITGTFLRLRLAPISRGQVLAGKGLASFLAASVAVSVLLLIGALLFRIRVPHPAMLAAAIVAAAFCFTGLMMVVAVLGRSPQSVSGAGWAIMLVMAMTGGGMIPLIAMPQWMQSLSNWSLVKWVVLGVEGAVWRGFGWAEMARVLAIPLAAGLVGMWAGTRALERSES
ncbi:MAG TPA: ABC transporter permease [Candidatus Eisenbacteria bacterium]